MEVNKETALRLWNKQFGKQNKARDFAGREIAKAAYDNRNSAFGWNVDHILPQSRGGKTADHNLICCHIDTNDEKADRFPCFNANGKQFEIQRRENHYEIFERKQEQNDEEESVVNFMDAAQGLHCWTQCKRNGGDFFAGFVKIKVHLAKHSDSLIEQVRWFAEEILEIPVILERDTTQEGFRNVFAKDSTHIFTAMDFNMPTKEDIQSMLDNCVVLNTYGQAYLKEKYGIDLWIYCGMECWGERKEVSYFGIQDRILRKRCNFDCSLAVDELIRINTSAKGKVKGSEMADGFYPYDYTFTKLRKNLEKRC